MKNLFLVFGLMMSTSVFAQSQSNVMVSCKNIPFSDIAKIEIIETDLTGQYQLIETPSDKRAPSIYSNVFGSEEINQNALPALSSRNGYTRTLVREVSATGAVHYYIVSADECTSSMTSVDCSEKF